MSDASEITGIDRIDLHPVGGIAGDMFAAAMFDAFPHLYPGFQSDLKALAVTGLSAATSERLSKSLRALHFSVTQNCNAKPPRVLSEVEAFLSQKPLDTDVARVACEIYQLLAEAEASVHGKTVETIHFHEVSDWDSMVDIVAAAGVISRLKCKRWRLGPLPLGGGMVKTAHGDIPVPAPATVHLLTGYDWVDDGEPGERVTPTGAAILAYLKPGSLASDAPRSRLTGSGTGCGSRELTSRANTLRVSVFAHAGGAAREHASSSADAHPVTVLDATIGVTTDTTTDTTTDATTDTALDQLHPGDGLQSDSVVHLGFEIDDMTAEELSIALQALRSQAGVLDVCSINVLGKKGRLATGVRILVNPAQARQVASECFRQTTTLGVRRTPLERYTLERAENDIASTRVKVARRPDELTAKADSDSLAAAGSLAERRRMAWELEAQALNLQANRRENVQSGADDSGAQHAALVDKMRVDKTWVETTRVGVTDVGEPNVHGNGRQDRPEDTQGGIKQHD